MHISSLIPSPLSALFISIITRFQGDSERAKEIALALQKKMDELEREMRYAAAKRVAEDFKDPLGPLNALTAATMAPPGMHTCMHACSKIVLSLL